MKVNPFIMNPYIYAGLPSELQRTIRRRTKVFNSLNSKYSSDTNLAAATKLIERIVSYIPEVASRSRKQKYVIYRMAYSYLCRTELGISTIALGELLGRDHSSIIHFTTVFNNFLEVKDELALATLQEVRQQLKDILSIKNDK